MRSRFFSIKEKEQGASAQWKKEPYFYRTAPGFYRLLSEEDKRVFNLALKHNLEIVFKDEYPIGILYSRVKSANISAENV